MPHLPLLSTDDNYLERLAFFGLVLLLVTISYLSRFYLPSRANSFTSSVIKSTAESSEPEMSNNSSSTSADIGDCPEKSFTSDEYTIGFITVLNFEPFIAKAMLDEEHEEPSDFEQSQADDNVYTWGRIGRHSVVLAAPASGSYGIAPAATTAKSMVMSIPSIRIGILVGIGGGIPCPNKTRDVRLGDVAVSNPAGSSGGIVQYDLGKQNLDNFERVGFIARPPNVLLKALTDIRANRMAGKSKMSEILRSLQRKMNNTADFVYQGRENDCLFSASVEHHGGNDCAECLVSSPHLASRNTRLTTEPEVHYGVIASGNTVMRDARHRDELAIALKDKTGGDYICYEMEAAGVMNDFPCLVIRGISNYADSHKNDRWQRYAAMTAVTYAKELLGVIPVRRVKGKKKATVATKKLDSGLCTVPNKIDEAKSDDKDQKIKHWLNPPDPSVNYNNALGQRHKNSGLWLLHSNDFTEWKTRSDSFLWLHGIPGCGKTILSSAIIKDLCDTIGQSRVLYFYFDFNNIKNQTVDGMIRSLTSQLYNKQIKARKPLDSLFFSCEMGTQQPTQEELRVTFLQMLLLQAVDEMWIVQDALDECQTRNDSQTQGLLSWIKDLMTSTSSNIHLLVTSRQEEDIESALMSWAPAKSKFPFQRDAVISDIRTYIRSQIHEDDGLRRWRWRPDVQEEIEIKLLEKSGGMFRWVSCQLDALRDCIDYRSLMKALASLPDTLDDTYARILAAIPLSYRETSLGLLQFLVFSKRPVRIEEAVDAIAVDLETDPAFDPKRRMPEPREISRYCPSLVVIITQQNKGDETPVTSIQLAHCSVKDYLLSGRLEASIAHQFREISAHASITKICLAYMSSVDNYHHLKSIHTSNVDSLSKRCDEIGTLFPLGQYAGRYWVNHARHAEAERDVQDYILSLYLQGRKFAVWSHLFHPEGPTTLPDGQPSQQATPLYHASSENLQVMVKLLLEKGADVNARGPLGSALQVASYFNHRSIVQLLVKNGADVDLQGSTRSSVLTDASDRGDEEIVRLLLKHGANINAADKLHRQPLRIASSRGHIGVVQLLLESGADVNIHRGLFGDPLHAAIYHGHVDIVRLLLKHGVDINQVHGLSGSPLQTASSRGHLDIVQILLKNGADVNSRGGVFGSPLRAAFHRGHETVVQLLLNHGAEDDRPEPGETRKGERRLLRGNERLLKED